MSSMIPFSFGFPTRSWWDTAPSRIYDQNFGMLGEVRRDLDRMSRMLDTVDTIPYWMQPRHRHRHSGPSGMSEVINDNEKFQVNLDVSHFTPEEIQVKTVENALVVEGKHEERMDEHGYIARHFTRKYFLPEDIDPQQLTSNLSAEGVLSIGAPKKALPAPEARSIPIQVAPKKEAIEQKQQKKK